MRFLQVFFASSVSLDDCSPRLHARGRGAINGFAIALAVVALLAKSSAVSAITIGSGFSAMWYDPARSGEGLQLEILDGDRALVEWYTYNQQGGQRWFQGVGRIARDASGDSIEFPQLYVTHGGSFGPAFDPAQVEAQIVGDATLSFSDCNSGTFRYAAFGQTQVLPVQRLTQTMGAGCTPINGIPGQPLMAYAGQSGSWFDVAHSGEGFALQWMSRNQAIVTWYTYDVQGNQIWLLGLGTEQDGAIVFEQMLRAHGPHFGTAFDPAALASEDWGKLTLQLNCNGGTAHYESSDAAFGSGDLTLTRLTQLEQPACPTLKPRLGDLYDITWNELPIETGTVQGPNSYFADSVAEDGTVAGRHDGHLVLWHPDTKSWEDVPRQLAPQQPVFISPDGSRVIATDDFNIGEAEPDAHTLLWQRSTGWQALVGFNLSIGDAASHNFQYVAGTGRDAWDGRDSGWIQAIDGIQQPLPESDVVPLVTPLAVSNDGSTVVGATLRFVGDFPVTVAVRWDEGSAPEVLRNPDGEELAFAASCNADCSIVFGDGLYEYEPDRPSQGEAWLLENGGAFEYLGLLPDTPKPQSYYYVTDATPNGSLVVGSYDALQDIGDPGSDVGSRAFIWTEATGIVSVRSLVNDLGIGDDDWGEVDAAHVSPDGDKIVLSGFHARDSAVYDPYHFRVVVLQLAPKLTSD
jgi:hypothetical protein